MAIAWAARLQAVGATAMEVSAIQAAYNQTYTSVQNALDQLIAGVDKSGLLLMLTNWRGGAGPFGAGFPGGGLPFGSEAPVLSGNPADDVYAISYGTGVKLAVGGGASVTFSSPGATMQDVGSGSTLALDVAASVVNEYRTGVKIPQDWGQFWKPKRNGAASALATIALVGDSICSQVPTSMQANAWPKLLVAVLQAQYGDGGSGFDGAWRTVQGVTTRMGSSEATYYATVPGDLYTLSGSWAWVGADTPTTGYMQPTAAGTNTATRAFRGSNLEVFYVDGGPAFTVTIDGGSARTVTPGGTYALVTVKYTGLSAGAHTAVISSPYVSNEGVYLVGIRGSNATGVILDDWSVPGLASAWPNNSDSNLAGTWMGGWQRPADLIIYDLAGNDVGTAVTADTWAQNVERYFLGALDTKFGGNSQGASDVMLMMPHVGQFDWSNYLWTEYQGRLDGIARTLGAGIVDFYALGRRSWNYWNSLGYWGNESNPGATSGSSAVHLSNAGHANMASVLEPLLST